ncbi:hypothetical protein SDC9_172772 [bioreactor metagenome]|uniref:Uncharacterized protein n=1 Tax=bioreactor metagenome TaxID=1076179 RepID=A0A645GNU4_9ZZZZ
MRQCFLHRTHYDALGIVFRQVGRDHDIGTVGKRPFGQRLIGLPSHNDAVSGGELLKVFQIFRKMTKQFSVTPDTVMLVESNDDGNLWSGLTGHMLTSPFICGCGS